MSREVNTASCYDAEALTTLTRETLLEVAERFGTPAYVYDAAVFRRQLASLAAFDTVRFAQKACPNVHVQRLFRAGGAAVDCVSRGELERALVAGFSIGRHSSEIVFTADVLTRDALERVVQTRVPVNAGSEDMLTQLGERSPGHPVWLRINPGFGHGHSKKVNTGGESSKHGIWHEQLTAALERVDRYALELIGLHVHVGSGADIEHLKQVCYAMVDLVKRADRDLGAVSGGGGLSIPYDRASAPVDVNAYYEHWHSARQQIEQHLGHPVELEIEPGRYLTAQAGVLIAEVRATKNVGGNHFTLVDAGFNDLVRPAMYGAYHELSLLSRHGDVNERPRRATVVAGPLCESGDVFTQNAQADVLPRLLPEAFVGDLMVFHDAGAYGASMGSNYNSRPLPPEVLVDDGKLKLIRRRQTVEQLLELELNDETTGA
ncbi:MAG TPA: diaminopimelate decarboxylase [Polyangiaceae bacterium]|nr:diaminopimelate decarboxylase [Polyangiaceae bacterium]